MVQQSDCIIRGSETVHSQAFCSQVSLLTWNLMATKKDVGGKASSHVI